MHVPIIPCQIITPLENLLLEGEPELVALGLEKAGEGGVAAKEDGHLALSLLFDFGKDFVPVGSTSVGS